MKKFLSVVLVALCSTIIANAQVKFAYEAGAELVSSYIWRGQYNGGLSFQPSASVGFEADNISFMVNAWGSVGASDWKFAKDKVDDWGETIVGTYFVPELDLSATLNIYGVTIGATHYYYFDGSKYGVNFGDPDENTTQLEVSLGYDFSTTTDCGLWITANTMIAGNDGYYITNAEGEDEFKRAWSTYIELGYEIELPLGFTLTPVIGVTPFRSMYNNYEEDLWKDKDHLGICNASLRLEKAFEIGKLCSINVFAQGMVNGYGVNKDNLWLNKTGEYKMSGEQKLNGCIGVGVWF